MEKRKDTKRRIERDQGDRVRIDSFEEFSQKKS